MKPGMPRRAWTVEEDQYLRDHYKVDQSTREIAVSLNRTTSMIYNRAFFLDLQDHRKCVSDFTIIGAIGRFHPQGWSDSEIADWLEQEFKTPVDRHRVGRIRRKLGYSANRLSPYQRDRVAAKTREQLAVSGHSSLAQLRLARWNQWKRDLGWPETLTVRAVLAAELFYRRGPMTRMQLCAAMGIDKKARLKRTEPVSNAKGGTVLAELANAGLLTRLRKSVRSGRDRRGGVRTVDLYMLNPEVSPNGETRKRIEVG